MAFLIPAKSFNFHLEKTLFHNLCVNLLGRLFPPTGRDARPLDFLDLVKNGTFLNGNSFFKKNPLTRKIRLV
jgi:hypothetical protein